MPTDPTLLHVTAAGRAPLATLIIDERVRKDSADNRAWIEDTLIPSITTFGLIQPVTVKQHDLTKGKNIFNVECEGTLTLTAGWSRCFAFTLLKEETIPYAFFKDIPKSLQLAMELEENLRRHDMSWQEMCIGTVKIHNLYQQQAHSSGAKWGQAQTGSLLGVSQGYLSEVAKIARLIESGDKEIIACKGLTDTRIVLAARKQDEIRAKLAKSTGTVIATVKKVTKKSGETIDNVIESLPDLKDGQRSTPKTLLKTVLTTASTPNPVKKDSSTPHHTIDLTSMLHNMDNRLWFNAQKDESYDLIYTDIPYGIDMANLDIADLERVSDEHDVDENIEQMPTFLANSFRVLKPNSYLLFWYDIKHQEKLVKWGEDVGFAVQPYPLIWIKTHECKNRAAHKWWTKAIEYVMVMAKGKATLSHPQPTNYFSASGKAERKLQNNPFAKPASFTEWLLKPIVLPGMKCADVYAGEGSLVRAMLNLGLDVQAVEKKTIHFNGLTEHVKKYYRQSLQGEVEFV